ncbi:MAG TPA: triose-phosphate isomerase [Stellaceae bacterium]|nr:triose-phosphate isomerase [Stellaceae bacterium]
MRKLVAGNWKMNGLGADGLALARALVGFATRSPVAAELLICPPATLLMRLGEVLRGSPIALGGQDCHFDASGAHTGDVSAAMLRDAGCRYVILGHSERRAEHHETSERVRAKVQAARAAGLAAIVCVGETAAEKSAGRTIEVVTKQLHGSIPEGLGAGDAVVAYEPVWAIGTGVTPSVAEIGAVHAVIRGALAAKMSEARAVRILYGGSVKSSNAGVVLAANNVDGALVGGASLNADDFWAIAKAAG